VTADLDGDSDLDIALARGAQGTVTLFLNDGGGIFAETDSYVTNDEALSLAAVDLDSDGDLDLVCGGRSRFTLLINAEASSVGDDDEIVPRAFALLQNYPNPFNPSTEVAFALPSTAHVRLEIFNVLGQRVRRLVDQVLQPGSHVHAWDGRDQNGRELPSGLYLYRLEAGSFVATKKMVLLK
jgi:hypothetical protein